MKEYKGFFSPLATEQSYKSFLITRIIILVVFLATAIGAYILSCPTLFGEGAYAKEEYTLVAKEPAGTGLYDSYIKYTFKYTYNNQEYEGVMMKKEDLDFGLTDTFYVSKKNPNEWSLTAPSVTLEIIEFFMGSIMAGAVLYISIMLPIGIIQKNKKKKN